MLMNVVIRPVQEKDQEQIVMVFMDTFNSAGENWSEENARKHIREAPIEGCNYVAEVDGKMIGILLAFPLTKVNGTELFIDILAVRPEYQNQGIGKELWKIGEQYIKDHGLVGICLQANPKLKSFVWYKRMGLKQSGWTELFAPTD